jgi:HD-GYP domain-containing protein (c-di-GMP phosphodiesterase class II)
MEPAENVSDDGFFTVSIDSLLFLEKAPCDLFRRNRGGEYVLLTARHNSLGRQIMDRLQVYGTEELFVRNEESMFFSRVVCARLDELVNDPNTTSAVKAKAIQAACRDTMRRAFEDPRGPFIKQACDVIVPTVDLIVRDDQATKFLVRLTAFDHATYIHSTNVGIFAVALARLFFGLDRSHDMHKLGTGFFLHDLGKCRIPLEILNKPGPLTPEERLVINGHVEEGYSLLGENGIITDEARTITLEHHEKDDGRGYPRGKVGSDIHPYARICRIADIYEALTAERPYHRKRSTFEALKIMKDQEVTDVDQDLFAHFIRLFTA